MSQPREARRGQSQRILQEVHLAGHQVDTQSLLYISGDERKISNHFFERWNMKPTPPKSMEALHGWCSNIVTAETSLGALGAGIDIRHRPIEITAETGIDIAKKVIETYTRHVYTGVAHHLIEVCSYGGKKSNAKQYISGTMVHAAAGLDGGLLDRGLTVVDGAGNRIRIPISSGAAFGAAPPNGISIDPRVPIQRGAWDAVLNMKHGDNSDMPKYQADKGLIVRFRYAFAYNFWYHLGMICDHPYGRLLNTHCMNHFTAYWDTRTVRMREAEQQGWDHPRYLPNEITFPIPTVHQLIAYMLSGRVRRFNLQPALLHLMQTSRADEEDAAAWAHRLNLAVTPAQGPGGTYASAARKLAVERFFTSLVHSMAFSDYQVLNGPPLHDQQHRGAPATSQGEQIAAPTPRVLDERFIYAN